MNFEVLKSRVLDDQLSTDEKLEYINELSKSDDPEVRNFIESLLKSKNIRIRYFVRKIIRDDIGLSEKVDKLSWKDGTDEKVRKIITDKDDIDEVKHPEVSKSENTNSSEADSAVDLNKSVDSRKVFLISVGVLVLILLISAIYVGSIILKSPVEDVNSRPSRVKEKYQTIVPEVETADPEKRKLKFQKAIRKDYEDGKYFDAYLNLVTLFNTQKEKIERTDYLMLVRCLEKMSWDFFRENRENAENYLNVRLRKTFRLVYQIHSAIFQKSFESEIMINSLLDNPPVLYLFSKDIIRRLKKVSDRFVKVSQKNSLKAIAEMYSKNFSGVRKYTDNISDPEIKQKMEKLTANCLKLFKRTTQRGVKKKDFLKLAVSAYELGNIEKAAVLYIKALTADTKVLRYDDSGLLAEIAASFSKIHFYDISGNNRMLLITGFSQILCGNPEKARKRLSEVNGKEYSAMARILIKISRVEKLIALLKKKSAGEQKQNLNKSQQVTRGEASDSKEKLYRKKDALVSSGKFDEAIDVLKQLGRQEPDNCRPFIELGEVYIQNGQTGDAILAFEKGLKLAPDESDIRVKLADLCFKNGEIKKARVHYGLTLFYETDSEVIDRCQQKIIELEKMKSKD